MAIRRLPIIVEQSVVAVDALRVDAAERFERETRAELTKQKTPITCQPGCAWCCHHPVAISILEGILIYRHLLKHGKWTLKMRERLKTVSDQQYGTTYQTWLLAMIPCPLLDADNRCSAYQARPLICRTYFAKSDPHYCHPHRLGVETSLIPRTEVVDQFHKDQERLIRKHKLQFLTMPIGAAVLLAERICKEEIDLSAVDSILFKEYQEKG